MKMNRAMRRAMQMSILAVITAVIALRLTPVPASLERGIIPSVEFLDRNGRPLRTMLVDQRRYARRVHLSEVSPHMIGATLSAEDRHFYHHSGVDPTAIGRAIVYAIRYRHLQSGASTITQQLIKLSGPARRTPLQKVKEICLAWRLELTWSKTRILEEYFNRLDYGNLQIGIGAASSYYFGKPPSDLSPAESAFVAGLPKAPSRLNPHSDLAAAQARQHWVLQRMRANGNIDRETFERALAEPIQLLPPRHEFEAPHFVDLLLQRRHLLPQNGGQMRTTLDVDLTHEAERCLADQLARITDKNATSGAVVVIHNPTGEVLALAGSGDYFRPGAGQINGAWSPRSPGSAIKPFTYELALERGANPCTVVADVPSDFVTPTGVYSPNNYNHRFYGPVSSRFALGNSLNVAAIRTLQSAGGPEALHRRLRELGITTLDHSAEYFGLGLTLGNAEVRLLELANAFASLARLGIHQPYRLMLDGVHVDSFDCRSGQILAQRVADPRASYLVVDMLADNSARAASFGLESFLAFDFPVACKTGTSSDYRDNWAIGFTPEFTVAVWVGNPDGSPMRAISGVTGAAPVMHDVMQRLHEERGTSWFKEPEGILHCRVNPLTGKKVAADRAGAVAEKCLTQPPPEERGDYDANGRVILPVDYAAWLRSSQNTLGNLVTCREHAKHLRIVKPAAGTVFYLDPDIPAEEQCVSLRAEAPANIEWSSDMFAKIGISSPRVQLREGRHVISARDPETGETAQVWIEVRAL
jgi:penicillin-binding protein 1C